MDLLNTGFNYPKSEKNLPEVPDTYLKDFILILVRRTYMGITKKFLNMFKSGKSEEEGERVHEEAQVSTQKVRYDNFLTALSEGDLDTRWSAVRSVGDLGEPFIEPLIRGLKDDYWIIRRGSADTLGKIGAPAVGPLIEALHEPGDDVRQEILRALQLIGEPSVGALLQGMKHSHPFVRSGSVQALGIMGEKRAVPPALSNHSKTLMPGSGMRARLLLAVLVIHGQSVHSSKHSMMQKNRFVWPQWQHSVHLEKPQ